MTEFRNIPVVDISGLRSDDPQRFNNVVQQLDQCARDVGFFVITNHGVNQDLIDKMYAVVKEFYALPQEEKNLIHMKNNRGFRGYTELGSETTLGLVDYHECIDFMAVDVPNDHPDIVGKKLLMDVNQFPKRPANFEAVVREYYSELKQLGKLLMSAMAVAFGFPREYFDKWFGDNSFATLRTMFYPPQPAGEETGIGVGEHTDYGFLTILTSNALGLEVKNTKGEWIKVPSVDNSYVCNIGDMLQQWSGNAYVSTPHKVISKQDRISIPFFYEPELNAEIHPMNDPNSNNKIHYGKYLAAKYQQSYPQYFP